MYNKITTVNDINLEANSLVVMFGIPGCGKSYTAAKLAEQTGATVVSSDAIREELYGTAECQDNPDKVFGILKQRTAEILKAGKSVIIDATSLIRKYRVSNLSTYAGLFKQAILIVCATELEIVLRQNAARDRNVPEDVIMRMYRTMSFPREDEGWDQIYLLQHPENTKTLEDYLHECWRVNHNNPHHPCDIYYHMLACEAYIRQTPEENSIAATAGRYHDIGKPAVKSRMKRTKNGWVEDEFSHYLGHADVSAYMMACSSDQKATSDVMALTLWHMDHYFNKEHLNAFTKLYPYLADSYKELTEADEACDEWYYGIHGDAVADHPADQD